MDECNFPCSKCENDNTTTLKHQYQFPTTASDRGRDCMVARMRHLATQLGRQLCGRTAIDFDHEYVSICGLMNPYLTPPQRLYNNWNAQVARSGPINRPCVIDPKQCVCRVGRDFIPRHQCLCDLSDRL